MEENPMLLTSSELASIWMGYLNDSMSKCILSYFLKDVMDSDIRAIIQHSFDLSARHIEKLTAIFEAEKLPLPTGFTSEDLNLNAPRLYTDIFMLNYAQNMAKTGLLAYSGLVSMSTRKDIRNYFIEGLKEVSELYDKCTDVGLSKGVYVRAPYINYPTKTDYVDDKSYFSGSPLFNKQRPLNAVEISHLSMNIQTNLLGSKIALSFAQTSQKKDIQDWMLRGNKISEKHVQIFSKLLIDNDIQPPASPDIGVTDSIIPPFSDKLTMFHMSLLSAAGTGNYATAATASGRNDLIMDYERLSLEIARYAKDGADLMIKHAWLEEPPGTKDKKKLAIKKNMNN